MFNARRRIDGRDGRHSRRCIPFALETLEPRRLLATFIVTNTGDSAVLNSGSLRAAILNADADISPGTDHIVFAIPASTAADLNVPFPGFDPGTQNWTIQPATALPAITRPVTIDGYTQTNVPFRYPSDISSAVQSLTVSGIPSGGSFDLKTSAPLPVGTAFGIFYDASAPTVQTALENIVGVGNVRVTGGPVNTLGVTISFQGAYADLDIPALTPTGNLTGGVNPLPLVQTTTFGGVLLAPSVITSVPNTASAISGNNAVVRVIIDGSNVPTGSTDIGFEINTSNSSLRGLAVEGFDYGVQVDSSAMNVGNLIQGNFIGRYVTYPVDPQTGIPLPSPNTVQISAVGNAMQGIVLGAANTTVGGTDAQENNVIGGNGSQGVLIEPGASGNQVLGNQIGVIGPINGSYYDVGNGAEGVLIQSSGTAANPASIVYASSNVIGGAVPGAGNVISSNGTYGVHIVGVGATRNLVEANYIGVAPGGGFLFGTGTPGNAVDGVWIDDAPSNQIGGPVGSDGNVISSNGANGVNITGVDATGNSILNNIIGLTAGGASVLGNQAAGVNDTAPGTVIGPGNVISANLIGVLISGATATNVTVIGNLIGTDSSGEADLGNAEAGVDIEGATGAIIEGNGQGSQVISGNAVGVKINGASAAGTLVEGNYIGVDLAGTADRGNSQEGVLIEGSPSNTVGGTTSAASNVISANLYGIQIDGATAKGNLVEGNLIGTDSSGTFPLGNEINGVIFSTGASNNTIGGTIGGQGNVIAFNVAAGVLVQSGVSDSILSNSIYSNGERGIFLNGAANDSQTAPVLLGAVGGGTGSNIQGSLTSVAGKPFLIQFFSSLVADPSGFGQGQTYIGSTTVTTDGTTGIASINFTLPGGVAVGTFVTALATNLSTGDTSAFSNAVPAGAVSVAFSSASYTALSTDGTTTITVLRSGDLNVVTTFNYATSNGSAIAGQDYTAASGTLVFPPNATSVSFPITILPNPNRSGGFSTVNLTLSQPGGGATLGAIASAILTIAYPSGTGKEFAVTNTNPTGPGSLYQAITDADADTTNPGVDNIIFNIPASTSANLDVPVAGFDPSTQTWTINLTSALPIITRPVTIDGYTQANVPVPFRYSDQVSSSIQTLLVTGVPTGGSFTLTTSAPLPVSTSPPIPYNATAAQVQSALEAIVGQGNVAVTFGPVNTAGVIITFQGAYGDVDIPNLVATNGLIGGIKPSISILTTTVGGVPLGTPSLISSVPNSAEAIAGNNAQVRVIINGGNVPSGASDIGFVINASNSILRGLAIEGFDVGVSVPNPTDVGDLIQGDFMGEYLAYPVDPTTGVPLPAPNTVELLGNGNTQQGIVLGSSNTTVGGTDPQDSNVIGGNGLQGVLIEPGASGNQVLGNQIGVVGPSSNGFYFLAGNGAEGVLILSSGTAANPSSIVYASSNVIGGAGGAGNLISDNHTYGIHIEGVGATRNLVEGNYIGAAPGTGFVFGTGQPGNLADGVWIDDAPSNQIGGPSANIGNVISSNKGNGVNITGADAIGNTVANNIIGLTAAGSAVLGNQQAGIADTAPGTVIGPGNVISANVIGVLISGATATNVTVIGNLIGTDQTGEIDLGNARAGVDIEGATGAIIEGNGQGSQVISGNLVGILINGASSTDNLVEGNYIGVDRAGTADRGNSQEGVLIEGSPSNTVGGTTSAASNVISANLYGIQIDGATAKGNLVEGNLIGTDASGTLPLGNEINGIIFSTNASNNSVGGVGAGQGNIIAFNVAAGVIVQSGIGDSILSNSIYSNGQQGIFLNGSANNAQAAPTLTGVAGGGTGGNVQGSLTSVKNTSFLIQFFSSLVADPSGFGQGQTFLGSTTVTTDLITGIASINFNLSSGLAVGTYVTATATNLTTGDTSAFSNAIPAGAVSVAFSSFTYTALSTDGTATITVLRSGNLDVASTVNYATSNGSAVAGQDYQAVSGTLVFPPGAAQETFSVPVIANSNSAVSSATVNLTLSQPGGGATLGAITSAILTINYPIGTGKEFVVTNTNPTGLGSLYQAISDANGDTNPGVDTITFQIPASTAGNLNVPFPGFDPSTQTWTISLTSALPVITHSVIIDGYTQANIPVPFRYPNQVSSAVQNLSVSGTPTGGSFTLTTSAPLPVGTTTPIPYNATAAQVQSALETILGQGNVSVTLGPVNTGLVLISFQGAYGDEAIPNLVANNSLIGGISPSIAIQTTTVGGIPLTTPTLISSIPNSSAALSGNNAHVSVIIDGSQLPTNTPAELAADIGFEVNASNSILRGMAIDGFNIGVEVPGPTNVGDLIQGNFIGEYLAYPLDPQTGVALPAPGNVVLAGQGNTQQGVVLYSRNTTLGGTAPQDSNVIGGNGAQGVLIEPGASGNQVLGNQIGVVGPSSNGFYFLAGNGDDGVLVLSSGTASNPSSIVYASSNIIGGAGNAGNLISDNHGNGVHIEGVGATRNLIEGNYIGAAPGGGNAFGTLQPGNLADGVWIDDAPSNQIGGNSASVGNVISSNAGNGVNVTGADATGNTVANNIIGLTAAGSAVLGNQQAGVADTAPGTVIGPGNVISANLIGVLISGASATDVTVIGNLIGTDSSGEADLGNAQAGVDIEGATGAIVEGNGQGSQVISGNLVGVEINGASSTDNLVEGNYIGIDRAGTADRGNSNEGVLIEGAPGNTVGGTTAAARNVISANEWGIRLDASTATGNLIEGNFIGTDATGTLPLGNEINGIIISTNASNNTIGGTAAGQGNTIDDNVAAGVSVQSGTGNSILSNSIYLNGHLGIDLVAPGAPPSGVTPNAPGVRSGPNNLQNYPVIVSAVGGPTGAAQATLNSLPNTKFLIQFFSSVVPDPSGYGQGQTLLGSQTVTTDSSGNAAINFQAASGLPSNGWITSTATNETTGDTSEFSRGITAQPVSVGFTVANTTVDSTAGVATILVDRTGNLNATVSVHYATSNGTAIAGTNYLAASGTLTFDAGVLEQSFQVTILPYYGQVAYSSTVNLTLSQPTGGATLGSNSTAVLTINEIPVPPPPPPPPPPPINLIAPKITAQQLIVSGRSITGITLTFSEAMNPTRAQDLSNYGFYVFSEGYRYTPAATYTTLSSASYNSSLNTVTLIPSSPLPANKFFEIIVDGQASPLLHNGLTDLSNNQLVGSSGTVGTPLYLNFALGNKLSYIDGGNNKVSLQLTKGGLMEIFISPFGIVQDLQLVSTVPGKSILAGSVRRLPHGTGRAVLPPIGGSAGARIRLKTPPFHFGAAPSIDAESEATPAVEAKPHARIALSLSRRHRRR